MAYLTTHRYRCCFCRRYAVGINRAIERGFQQTYHTEAGERCSDIFCWQCAEERMRYEKLPGGFRWVLKEAA